MTETYRVAILNKPLRVFGLTPLQMLYVPFSMGLATLYASKLGSNVHILGVPLSALLFISMMCLMLVPIQMVRVKPFIWWKRYVKYLVNRRIAVAFPEIEVAHKNHSLIQLSKEEYAELAPAQQRQMLELLTDFAGKPGHSLQIFAPAVNLAGETRKREFYIISDSSPYSLNDLEEKLERSCLPAQKVDDDDIRKMLFKYLSPGHQEDELPPVSPHSNDLLTLCTSGFDQQKDHLRIDGKFVSSFYFQTLPPESYFGFVNRLMEVDCSVSLSTFLKSTAVANLRRVVQLNYDIQKVASIPEMNTPKLRSVYGDIAKIASGQIPAIDLSVYLTLYADSLEELSARTLVLQNFTETCGVTLSPATVQEFDALLTMLPLNRDMVGCSHTVTPLTAQTFVPFT